MPGGIQALFDRPRSGDPAVSSPATRALLVHLATRGEGEERGSEEFVALARATGADPIALVTAAPRRLDARYCVGTGKVDELRARVESDAIDLAIFNHRLSPAQERNLEAELKCRVLDRIGLILDIFAQRASTFEGKLQVELAQLRHLSTRLVRGWMHLERQRGGIGLRGPGETQLETDRRLVGRRIERIERQLDAVKRRREVNRRTRRRTGVPVAALVGYTNSGKSTLFNRLTGARVPTADQLFATLDPTLRRAGLPSGRTLVVVDTVGFVGDLPHELVAAFRATLEETRAADLLLHVVDASVPDGRERARAVNEVLREIGAGALPQIEVMNKADSLPASVHPIDLGQDLSAPGVQEQVWVSARTGRGITDLLRVLEERLGPPDAARELRLPPGSGRLRARLYERGVVLGERACDDGGSVLEVRLEGWELARFRVAAGIPRDGADEPPASAGGRG